ncbi:hypothetical protein NIES4071_53380 [Calothrix sp. NIES-4071]|nr:hypothetical protein NIES4071_53380 [Calothrix sp. NIES-4071]BAZ59646.1 hypothetical protein NIES4105_53330 [Calothrix sp. NIES-4105]
MTCNALPLPISETARLTARSFAQQQPTREKAEKVLLNTLSVLTVSYYLYLMGVSTDIDVGDSWNPVIRLSTDIADLEVPGVGKIECRPASIHDDFCYIPPETWGTRAAYVVVVIDESLREAKIMGFVKSCSTEVLHDEELLPLEDLVAHLEQQKLSVPLANLSRWLTGVVENGWQTVESLLDNAVRPAYVFRSAEAVSGDTVLKSEVPTTRRAKLFDLGIQIANQPVILIVEIKPQTEVQTSVRLQLYPTGAVYLQPGVVLSVLDESHNLFLEAQSRSADNYIQLQFSGEVGERFSVRLGHDEAYIIEHFVI